MNWRGVKTACAAVVLSALCLPAFSQNYYLVIGAFSSESDNVKEFTSYLPSGQFDTAYTIQSNNNSLHMYIMKTSSRETALAKGMKLQEELATVNGTETVLPSNQRIDMETKMMVAEPQYESLTASASNKSSESVPSGGNVPMKPKGKYFKFTIASEDGSIMPGEVHHVDRLDQKELGSFSTDLYIDMMKPGPTEPMTVVAGVFGYKEVDKYIDFANPSDTEGAYQDEHGAWIIPYKLERLEKGDVSVMYNVGYYKDAVAMTPPSKRDLDELVSMMKQNPNYVIKVHAHCNGKYGREVIALGADNNYFETTGSTQVRASAKELTNMRAQAIKSYLMLNGISEERVKSYAWGGSEMLVSDKDVNARLNDRIEIEVLKD
jgi:outer membrane protein OmpA-like peptidoglycan-associated protein